MTATQSPPAVGPASPAQARAGGGGEREFTPRAVGVVAATLVGSAFSGGLVAMAALAVFMAPIARDYGWSRGAIGGAMGLLYVGMAASAPLFGRAVDTWGPRRVLLPLTALSALLLGGFPFIGRSLPLFYAAHFLLGMSQPGAVTYSKLVSSWFFRRRGVALAAMGVGGFIAQVGAPPAARLLMEHLGWRHAYLAFAGAELFVSLPFLVLFFRERQDSPHRASAPEAEEVRPDGAPFIGVLQAMRGGDYWLILATQVAVTAAYLGVSTHGVGLLGEHGLSPAVAVWGLSTSALGGVVSQMLSGYLLDRFDTPRVVVPFALLALAGLLLLQVGHGRVVVLAAVFLFGAGCAAATPVSYLASRYFGVRNLSAIYGSLFPITLVLSAPMTVLVGLLFDATRSYGAALWALAAVLAASVLCFLLLRPYPFPTKR